MTLPGSSGGQRTVQDLVAAGVTEVYRSSHRGGRRPRVHLDPDCPNLDNCDPRERDPRALYDDDPVCTECDPLITHPTRRQTSKH